MAKHTKSGVLKWLGPAFLGATLLLPYPLFTKNKLQVVKATGRLVVLTINGPTTYYEGPSGFLGFEYDLAKAFAEYLGVKIEFIVADTFSEVLPQVASGKVDLAAAGITITEPRKQFVRYSPAYQEIRQQVVYRRGNERPRTIRDLIGRDLAVVSGTSFVERLNELKTQHPDLEWVEIKDIGVEELLIEVWEGFQDLTIADSNIVAVVRQFYPELHVAFNIQKPEQLAWAVPLSDDNSLYYTVEDFLEQMTRSGELARLQERYYGPAGRTSYLDIATYQRRIEHTLPLYRDLFQRIAREVKLDWRLLAAMAYQESLWNPEAVSPTGVRGIMMLTRETAKYMSVENRVDPEESIRGGARYLKQLHNKIPPSVQEPDRIWMALAAYNVGRGHLEDARIIAQKQGGNPNKWVDVKERLPLLTKPRWYGKTKHGYARGYEPVQYVTRIRVFYDVLVRIDEEEKAKTSTDALELEAPAI